MRLFCTSMESLHPLFGTFVFVAVLLLILSVESQADDAVISITAESAEVQEDWLLQDVGFGAPANIFTLKENADQERILFQRVFDELLDRVGEVLDGSEEGQEGSTLQKKVADLNGEFGDLVESKKPGADPAWRNLYRKACTLRRQCRLAKLADMYPEVVFTKHYDFGGSHYAYTTNTTDAQYAERQSHNSSYRMGSHLCVMRVSAEGEVIIKTLLDEPNGVIRDPDVSYDGRRVLFSMRHSADKDDYHLYEMEVADRKVRPITSGEGYADYEGIYLPSGDILFNSTRCTQVVDCWYEMVSNLYVCDKDGGHLRRISVDQVHTNYPQLLGDGSVIYTRWDYNDRGQLFPQPLFMMNADGTNQREFYGNNSWFPTTLLHARPIPGTQKVVAISTGHHTHQRGKLAIVDPALGRQENSGITYLAPEHKPEAVRIDAYGQEGPQFQYPYPIDEQEFLVTFQPIGSSNWVYPRPYGIYWIDRAGRRELLAFDATISCNQPVLLAVRPCPPVRATAVDYRQEDGMYYMQDIYIGPGLKGIERGRIKKLRVVALDFRAAWIGHNENRGASGGAYVSTPVSIGNGTWDLKKVLGEATVYDDGSACFTVPSMTPVYFQALDENRHVVQTMRSWSTLQPGEKMSCVGCHEDKNQTPGSFQTTMAMHKGAQALEPFYGPVRGFSFVREIQPILDRHCVECHQNKEALLSSLDQPLESNSTVSAVSSGTKGPEEEKSFSMTDDLYTDSTAKRQWSHGYLALTRARREGENLFGNRGELVNWLDVQSEPTLLPPYYAGAAKSRLITMLREGHHDVRLSQEELDKIACWIDLLVPYCGDYRERNAWTPEEQKIYDYHQSKRDAMEAMSRESRKALAE